MGSLYLGSSKVGSLYLGTAKVKELYKGSTKIFSASSGNVVHIGEHDYTFVQKGSLLWLTQNLYEDIDGNQPYLNNDPATYAEIGRFYSSKESYQWDDRNPNNTTGWRVPTASEWRALLNTAGSWQSLINDEEFKLYITGEYDSPTTWHGIGTLIRMLYRAENVPAEATWVIYPSSGFSSASADCTAWSSSAKAPLRLVKNA